MELYLQFGWGMMEHCRHLLAEWGGGTVILSPRDLSNDQLERLSNDIHGISNTEVLLDPQFYLPHADHERLCAHSYWPSDYDTGMFWQGQALTRLLTELNSLNSTLGCSELILPGILADAVDDDWVETQQSILEEASARVSNIPIVMTIALSADAVRNADQVGLLIDQSASWRPRGYYLVFEHPLGSYLVDDPIWLANALDIAASLRMRGHKIIMGYCNHQMLIAAVTKANAIASGTWMNVRSFPPDKFRVAYDDEIKQRSTWYYCPHALSEYKLPFLDVAHMMGMLDQMQPDDALDGGYASRLFSGPRPSTIGLTEQSAFRHYLHALRAQVLASEQSSFDDTLEAHRALLRTAETILAALRGRGISGQLRDFSQLVDVNSAALTVFDQQRGTTLRRKWTSLV